MSKKILQGRKMTYPQVGFNPTDVVPKAPKDAFKFFTENFYKHVFTTLRGVNNINYFYQYIIDRYMIFHYTFIYLLSQYDGNTDYSYIHSQITSLLGFLANDFQIMVDPKNNFQIESVLFSIFVFVKSLIVFLDKTKFRLAGNHENLSKHIITF